MDARPEVKGIKVDADTRCDHYHTDVDIVAIKFYCCQSYYACYSCHEELAGHAALRWPKEKWNEKAILCGKCSRELTILTYMESERCPHCQHPFNARCSYHFPLYFEME
ncbi:CHY zinc finger protein [Halobacillus salinarum]|uniref:CHY zinc finger protein n=1 Tax=Halobacillus salinarum TaxID=2932257 RepID=A0ABY4EHR5_9BACI|nr:CHY zinc finger protein [Halobacillus salinarum]UOQ44005.1 CHY zinc finger protein [Halobacillus salinarum]